MSIWGMRLPYYRFFFIFGLLLVGLTGVGQVSTNTNGGPTLVAAVDSETLVQGAKGQVTESYAEARDSRSNASDQFTPEAAARLERLASDPKLHSAHAVLAAFARGESEARVIVTLEPTSAANDLAAQSAGSPNRPSSFNHAGAPVYYDLQNQAIREQLHDTVTKSVGQFIADNQQVGLTVTQRFSYQFGFAARVNTAALEQLLAHPDVLRVEEDGLLEPHLRQGIPLMQADTPRVTYKGSGVSIAIADTGIDTAHPRLGGSSGTIFNAKVIGGVDTGDNDADPRPGSNESAHGTACAGIAAGDLGDTGDYIGGVAPSAKLYAIKIARRIDGLATTSAMIAGWEWPITHQNDDPNNPILIISTSFGGGNYANTCDMQQQAMTTAAANAVAAGISLFASSGNNGYCASMQRPACISFVNSVGAVYDDFVGTQAFCVDQQSCVATPSGGCPETRFQCSGNTAPDLVTCYSNSASFLTLFAPSNDAFTTDIVGAGGYDTGDYVTNFGGTSAACPYAAGAAAVLQSAAMATMGRFLTPAEITTYLTTHGTLITDNKAPAVQKPRVNLASAIDALPGKASAITNTETAVTVTTATLGGTVTPHGSDTSVVFEYGLTTNYGSSIAATPNTIAGSAGSTGISATLSGLTCNTTYHYRIRATNNSGVGFSDDQTFTTSVCFAAILAAISLILDDDIQSLCQSGALALNTPTTLSGVYRLSSAQSITTSASVQVQTGADVTFVAPSIRLGPGFRVALGAKFRAEAHAVTCP